MSKTFESRLDFYEIVAKNLKANTVEIYPDYVIDEKMEDLMVRGGSFYAVWDPDKKIWNRKETCVKRLVDADVKSAYEAESSVNSETILKTRYLKNNSSGKWAEFKAYIRTLPDMYFRLDEKVTFRDPSDSLKIVDYRGTKMNKEDHISKCLPYSLQKDSDPPPAWNELVSTLFDKEER